MLHVILVPIQTVSNPVSLISIFVASIFLTPLVYLIWEYLFYLFLPFSWTTFGLDQYGGFFTRWLGAIMIIFSIIVNITFYFALVYVERFKVVLLGVLLFFSFLSLNTNTDPTTVSSKALWNNWPSFLLDSRAEKIQKNIQTCRNIREFKSIESTISLNNMSERGVERFRECVYKPSAYVPLTNDNVDSNSKVTTDKYSLKIDIEPKDAKIQIMNIGPKFYQGIGLEKGRYDIKISKPGYTTKRFWIGFSKHTKISTFLMPSHAEKVYNKEVSFNEALKLCRKNRMTILDHTEVKKYLKYNKKLRDDKFYWTTTSGGIRNGIESHVRISKSGNINIGRKASVYCINTY